MRTHDVTNQVPTLQGHDVYGGDPALTEAVDRWVRPHDPDGVRALHELGRLAGTPEARTWADQADRVGPLLRTHAPTGERLDEVEFHPAYHRLMEVAVGEGLTAEPWTRPEGTGAHARRAAGFLVWSQVEAAHMCPVSMTYSAAPALLANAPGLAEQWVPGLASRGYDPVLRPRAKKPGLTVGMGMTEKQGGSDVRANTTRALAAPGGPLEGETYRLTGHKWFCSAPMSDGFLVLGQADAGVTCFLLPRVLDDGTRNAIRIQRLKDKLGNRANASSEIELEEAWALRVGDEGRGVRTIIDMVASTRLDCVLGSTATMRAALTRAVHHARHRSAFGARLVDQPLMRNVLGDLALETEAATVLGMRLAHAVDAGEHELSRLGVALGKFWVCKRTAPVVAEALECLGGNGYVEENGLARLYREAPLNSIWEGSGNVNALDVLRAIAREPASLAALGKELALARGYDPGLDAAIDACEEAGAAALADDAPWGARRLVERLALTLQAALLVRHSPGPVADAFVASRVRGEHGAVFGTLDAGLGQQAARTLIERALPS
ncbi:acyl-CoA dehydrogenase family protein [Phycicoccus endophyticus]|uniref:Acyl-CoA dehydrogenase family protein n=1 Tax=Phycicoccus endophyticus TaxID=1690220 RepID=A0A7G9R4S5_9MICO|nr:acyl-CoA dehydrogenase family protein [Phycicoccus endophyticus]NHI18517.1 DNA alkylation response protein [Phycicoccus endophyticus]QNN50600.1 acyl-CoA dehydrogenase family protein [Phycicoccus endophyticus]GGL23137.1 acyl-CoA dehydrogenase [Phycicoccus endophyticus]